MSTVQLKRSAVASKVPLTTDLSLGELAINTYDGKIFFKKDPGTPSIVTVAMTADKLSAFAATTSAELASVISDETGSGNLVFSSTATLTGTLLNGNTNFDSGSVFIDGTNNLLLVGSTTPYVSRYSSGTAAGVTSYAPLQVHTGGTFDTKANFTHWATGTVGGKVQLGKSKGGVGTHTIVAASDVLGELQFLGSDGSEFVIGATIRADVEGTPAANNISAAIVFRTANTGSGSNIFERMRVSSNGNVGIGISSPTEKLHVEGTTRSLSFASANGSASAPAYDFAADTNTGMFLAAADTIGFTTNGAIAAQFTSTGNLRLFNTAGDSYTEISNQPTANNTLTLPNSGNVTLVSGTMVPTTGTGATGTWGISVSGSAATPIFSSDVATRDNLTTRFNSGFYQTANGTIAEGWPKDSNSYQYLLSVTHNNPSNYYALQIAAPFYSQELFFRNTNNSGTQSWSTILHSGNYNTYSPTLTGTGATGTWGISVTGNAATVTNGVYTTGDQTIDGIKSFTANTIFDTDTLFVDAVNNRVGIGTTAPTTKLDIYDATSSALTIRGDTAAYMRLERSATDTLEPGIFFIKTRGTQAAKTAVASGDATGAVVFRAFGGTNNRTTAAIRGYVDTYVSDTNLSGSLRFYTTNASTSETEWMRISSNGNVGIGNTTPTDRLSIGGTVNITGNTAIAGILTQSANATFSGALVNITSANTTIGDAATDVLNVNAISVFNANTTLKGSEILIDNASGSGGSAEGGELHFAIPTANTTLSGPIAIDIYQNKIRFFETTGTNRGAYIDLTAASTNAGSDLLTSPGTNLTQTSNGSTVTVFSDTGTDAIILAANATTAGILTAEAQTIGGSKTFSANTTLSYGYFGTTNGQANASAGVFTSNAYAYLGGAGGNYLAFGQQTNFSQWIQSGYSAVTPTYYPIILNPLGGNVGIGETNPTQKLDVNGIIKSYAFYGSTILDTALTPAHSWSADADTGMYQAAANKIGFTTGGTPRATLDSTGLSMVNGNIIFSTNGTGIDFSATAGGSATSSVLSDYEEGTWTPAVEGSTTAGTATYTTAIGRYVKIGRLVHVVAFINYSAGTGAGNLLISGFPYASLSAGNANVVNTFVVRHGGLTVPASSVVMGYLQNNASKANLYSIAAAGAAYADLAYDAAATLAFSIVYESA